MHLGNNCLRRDLEDIFDPGRLEGFVLVEEQVGLSLSCSEYVLGCLAHRAGFPDSFRTVQNPRKGDLVLYTDVEGTLLHLGKYLGGNRVESKWGPGGSVFAHPIDMVPSSWGNKVLFYRKR